MRRIPSFALATVITVLSAACSSQSPPLAPSAIGSVRVDAANTADMSAVIRSGMVDARTLIGTCTVTVSAVSATPNTLWSPNHKWNNVTVSYTSNASCVPAQTVTTMCFLSVSSNEDVNGLGDGNTSPDWQVVDTTHVRLRAERSGLGTGRVYTITATCRLNEDINISSSNATQVTVAHDQGKV
jgi:hypothetical protein